VNETYPYAGVQVQSHAQIMSTFVLKEFIMPPPVHIFVLFEDGNVFLVVLSVQHHVFLL
jgi:hypothetical protein